MLLGRKTYLEMIGWFTDQTPLVLTGNPEFSLANGFVANSIPEAISLARHHNVPELVVSGGATAYKASMPWVDTLIITRVEATISGSIRFPEYDTTNWKIIESQSWSADQENNYAMTFQTYIRCG